MSKKKMSKRKRGYIELFIVLIIFTLVIFVFDLPKVDTFIIIGVIAVFNIFIFEIFRYNNDKK